MNDSFFPEEGLHPEPATGPDFAAEVRRAAEEDVDAAPFERSYWVLPGKFLAGAYPLIHGVRGMPGIDEALFNALIRRVSALALAARDELPDRERVQRLMWAAPGSEPIGKPEEVGFVDRIQHLDAACALTDRRRRAIPNQRVSCIQNRKLSKVVCIILRKPVQMCS